MKDSTRRRIGLMMAVMQVALSIIAMVIATKIVAVSGQSYRYLLPTTLLVMGIYLVFYWARRLIKG